MKREFKRVESGSPLRRLCGGERLGMRGQTQVRESHVFAGRKPFTSLPSPRSGARGVRVLMLYALVLLVGCSTNEAPKTSLFEDDHVVAAHWPSDLADLSAKLRERAAKMDSLPDASLRSEIEDLVGWVGEVAADTNLAEADWVPLYERSEAVAANLGSARGVLTGVELKQIESLCRLVDETIPRIPEQLASVTGMRP